MLGLVLGPDRRVLGLVLSPDRRELGRVLGPDMLGLVLILDRRDLGRVLGPDMLGLVLGPDSAYIGLVLSQDRRVLGLVLGPDRRIGRIVICPGSSRYQVGSGPLEVELVRDRKAHGLSHLHALRESGREQVHLVLARFVFLQQFYGYVHTLSYLFYGTIIAVL